MVQVPQHFFIHKPQSLVYGLVNQYPQSGYQMAHNFDITEQLGMTAYVKRLLYLQKQPPEVFRKERCSQKFHKIRKKTPVQSLCLNKSVSVSGLQLIKKETLAQVFSCEFYEISGNLFYRTPLDECFCTLGNKFAIIPSKTFNLSSYFKQTLQNKPLGKLFSNSTINHGNFQRTLSGH